MLEQLVVFVLDDEAYALPIRRVQEIIRYTSPRTIPGSGYSVLGVINLRSKIIPVCDIRGLLGLSGGQTDEAHASIVILDTAEGAIGLVVDRVSEVTSVDSAEIDTTANSSGAMQGIVRVNDKLVVVLDTDRLATEVAPGIAVAEAA
jgi:purine-binding chemotaxis protein CheW